MKHTHQTTTRRLAVGAAIMLIALLVMLGLASPPPTEANQPEAQFTALFNPDFGVILQLAPTATPRPFDGTGILIDPNLNVLPFVTVPPILAIPTAPPTPEPCGHAITLGKAVNDTLKAGGQHCEYTFAARAGQTVTITMRRTTGGIDPLIELLGPSGGRIAMDDDSDGRGNSILRGITLDEAGTYTVVARSFDPSGGGTFQLSVTGGRPNQGGSLPGAEEVLCSDTVRYGQSVESQVPFPGAECWYSFAGTRGDTIALRLTSLDGSPLPDLRLLNARGRAVAGAATTLDDGTVVLSDVLLPANGSYTIVLTDATATGAGPFELSLIRQDPCKDLLSYFSVRAEISADNPACTFALLNPNPFYASVTVTAVSGDLQPLVQFYGPGGELLEEYVSDGSSQRAPENTWTVVVEGLDGTTGVFEISISTGVYYVTTTDFCGGSLSSGQFVRDTVNTFLSGCRYTFDGAAGDVVTIRMTRQSGATNDLDTFLTLLDPDEDSEFTDDDGGLPPTNSLIKQHTLETTGRYTVVAGSYNDATFGPFYLTFWQRSP